MALVVWTHDVDEAFAHLALCADPTVRPPHHAGNIRGTMLRDPGWIRGRHHGKSPLMFRETSRDLGCP
jgi:hypothetical protein